MVDTSHGIGGFGTTPNTTTSVPNELFASRSSGYGSARLLLNSCRANPLKSSRVVPDTEPKHHLGPQPLLCTRRLARYEANAPSLLTSVHYHAAKFRQAWGRQKQYRMLGDHDGKIRNTIYWTGQRLIYCQAYHSDLSCGRRQTFSRSCASAGPRGKLRSSPLRVLTSFHLSRWLQVNPTDSRTSL
jgi:hypothetical protein